MSTWPVFVFRVWLGTWAWTAHAEPAHYRPADGGALLQDLTVTPGAIREDATREQLCANGFTTRKYRHTTHEMKCQAYANYGWLGPGCKRVSADQKPATGSFEVDHLIPLTIGGADDVKNLWPQPAEPTPGFHQKDKLENLLHRLVCKGLMELLDAQKCISEDWWACMQRVSK